MKLSIYVNGTTDFIYKSLRSVIHKLDGISAHMLAEVVGTYDGAV